MKCPYCFKILWYIEEDVTNVPKGTIPVFICTNCAGICAIVNGKSRFLTKVERKLLKEGNCPDSFRKEHDEIVSHLIG